MFLYLAVALSLAVCHAQHTHPTHPPTVAHTFNGDNALFYQDFAHNVIVLKTVSGCYLGELTDAQVKAAEEMENLLKLEARIIHQAKHAHHYHLADKGAKYSAEIEKNCDTMYLAHEQHNHH